MTNKLKLLIGIAIFVLLAFASSTTISARSLSYDDYVVDIIVNEDSTVDVTETLSLRFNGEYKGVLAEIPTNRSETDPRCDVNVCGGFEFFALEGVYDADGRKLNPNEYEYYTLEDEDTGEEFVGVRRTLWPNGKVHDGSELVKWSFKYRLYGSLGWDKLRPWFYWNIIPDRLGGAVKTSTVNITLPSTRSHILENMKLLSDQTNLDFDESYEVVGDSTKVSIHFKNLIDGYPVTVDYILPAGSIVKPALLRYSIGFPYVGVGLKIDGVDLGTAVEGVMNNFPTGKHKLTFSHFGFYDYEVEVDAKSTETVALNFSMSLNPLGWFLVLASFIGNVCGLVLIPFGVVWVYLRWRRLGRDAGLKTVIPLYEPPAGMRPYLLGALKDEKVDQEDITGTIIDLAYRGFLKIREIDEDKEYELISTGKNTENLDDLEKDLLRAIFGKIPATDEVVTAKLSSIAVRFATSYRALVDKVYSELVARKYFTVSPEKTRQKYAAAGGGLFILGIFLAIGAIMAYLFVIGTIGPGLFGLGVAVTGAAILAVAQFMPAKTQLGGEIFTEVLGFRMYLHHAERYRLQGLKPEEFEKYLSYAIVFGIEKEWADKFKDIYHGHPAWLESSDSNIIWDAYWMSRFTRSFSSGFNHSVYSPMRSGSGGVSGGGWSGGGGGGFSGGGGGGGGRGGF